MCACSPAIDKSYPFSLCRHSCIFILRQQCKEFACELGHGCMRLSTHAGMWLFDQITETVISCCQLPVERVHAYVCMCACVCVSMMEHKGPFLSAPECGLCLVSVHKCITKVESMRSAQTGTQLFCMPACARMCVCVRQRERERERERKAAC